MQKIEELMELVPAYGFKLVNATTQWAPATVNGIDAGLDTVVTLEFLNDNHVKIDVYIVDGEISVEAPYAVDADMKPISFEKCRESSSADGNNKKELLAKSARECYMADLMEDLGLDRDEADEMIKEFENPEELANLLFQTTVDFYQKKFEEQETK